jgi:hypothetical protein
VPDVHVRDLARLRRDLGDVPRVPALDAPACVQTATVERAPGHDPAAAVEADDRLVPVEVRIRVRGLQARAHRHVPDTHGAVLGPRHEELAARRELDVRDRLVGGDAQLQQLVAHVGVPDPRGAVVGARGDLRAVGAEGDVADGILMSAERRGPTSEQVHHVAGDAHQARSEPAGVAFELLRAAPYLLVVHGVIDARFSARGRHE